MKRSIYLSLLACLFSAFAWGQTRQVTGRVVSDSNIAVAGASVSIKGTTTAVATNNEGQYNITVPDRNNIILSFSSVGYSAQDVTIGNRTVVDVRLTSSAAALSDVVVVGYSSVRRKDLSGSVSSVTSKPDSI